ncbi:MAG: WD40 repeat domain-containing protein [Planctomycetaceae bacterium]
MSESSAPSPAGADWIRRGTGATPALGWSFVAEGSLTALATARESGETFVADADGILCRLDRLGRIAAITRLHNAVRFLAWSDDGHFGVAVCGEGTLHFLNHVLQSQWQLELPDPIIAVAMAPFGGQVFVACSDRSNRVYDAAKKRLSQFDTMRPIAFARFVTTEPLIAASAEHGLVCLHQLDGQPVWSDKLWSNVGSLAVAGDGHLLYLACQSHGVQVYDGDGRTIGAYVLDGTASRVDVSFDGQRIVAATIERKLFWLDADGEILWSTSTPDDIESVACDPLGEAIVCGLKCGRIYRLDWTRKAV